MFTVSLFAFLAGLATALSPCILPVLPFMLATATDKDRLKPLFIVAGFIVSFCAFTLSVSALVHATGLSPSVIRNGAIVLLFIFGISMLIPKVGELFERLTARLPSLSKNQEGPGYGGAILMGASLGLVWAPCAGPIFATIAALIATQTISVSVLMWLLAYACGAGLPLLAIAYGGQTIIKALPILKRSSGQIRKGFGVITILVALLMYLQLDTALSASAASLLPQKYLELLSKSDNNAIVAKELRPDELAAEHHDVAALPILRAAPELQALEHWINTNPLTLSSLRGKVVLVDFWTYSCVNCARTLPYLKRWYEKYRDAGLVIIGVHSPEFAFEQDYQNVERAVTQNGITYPVALDNSFGTWKAFENHYWPAHYFIDVNGNIRYQHFGEGEYERSEEVLRQLLSERGAIPGAVERNATVTAPIADGQSPETYLGLARMERFSSAMKASAEPKEFTELASIASHHFTVGGAWKFNDEFAESVGTDSSISFAAVAKDVYLVLDGADGSSITVTSDSGSKSRGSEQDQNGVVALNGSRLYHVASFDAIAASSVHFKFSRPGIKAYAFTFGG